VDPWLRIAWIEDVLRKIDYLRQEIDGLPYRIDAVALLIDPPKLVPVKIACPKSP
jgi:hypothetical protein